ncbi:DUF2334 domain-containing protein [Romboutsia lituseburensis]|uniref:DUF2334 domain-containing protein n=1 Tax=Romboutsia lituseburensis TaxID=1537 RepID=UPI00215A8B3D|nr:DUF2334 domain-containing protein [Romboutsia lituseburensis]MCR8743997.1 DUF2334 domain-containing protein [Romboutsia lituseburensis]
MMYKKFYVSIFIIAVFLFNVPYFTYANTNKKSLIVYENEKTFSSNENKVNHLKELLYVFNEGVEKINLEDYKKEYINNFDSVFVINIKNDISNEDFLYDISIYDKNIYWIGNKIENILEQNKKYSISYKGKIENINAIFYKNKKMILQSKNEFNILSTSKGTEILSTMGDGYNEYPYIIREKNLYYISQYNLGENFVFEDSLNDFFEVKNNKNNEIFIKINNVNPNTDIKALSEISNYLYSQSVPFLISLTPTYTNSKNKNTEGLNLEFIEVLQKIQEQGGVVVLNGYSKYKEDKQNNEYEFWDIKSDSPITNDIKSYIKDRVLRGLRICIENNIYPLAFEAPSGAMDNKGYIEIKKYFSTFIGYFQNNNDNYFISSFPYKINKSDLFNTFLPENLGILNSEDEFSTERVKENLDKLSVVRGYSAGLSISPNVKINNLDEIIQYIKDNNIEFIDLRFKSNYVKIEDISIKSKNGNIYLNYDKSKSISKESKKSNFEITIKNINDMIIGFVSFVLVIFFIIFIVFRKINTNKFTRR